ncbi:MAG: hypothetical protein A3J40_06870 [Erythrobacter sp. RIFCSPHIGHO2_12_FULL_63_10]|nr:MAG: hypothetical protein A3J40_06870 [Erythrobacter sp. RIFCSPHIGHO2_12_FULL_63_10]
MCCGNYLHTHVEFSPSDRNRLSAAGIDDTASQDRFDFPCQFLNGACCTIYPSRPAVCATYRCKTLTEAQSGAISLDEAKERLCKIAENRRAFEATVPEGMTIPAAIALAASEPTPGWQAPDYFPKLRLSCVALQAIIDRYLREESDGVVHSRMG